MIFPELQGKLNGHAVRVPLLNGSLTDAVFELEKEVTQEEVNHVFKEASEGELKGILGYEEKPLVSIDYVMTQEVQLLMLHQPWWSTKLN